jgi:diguanylate cyclase (GGDEF)-like protein
MGINFGKTANFSKKPNAYSFTDLVDINDFAETLQHFYLATGIANGIVSLDGELLTQTGWNIACQDFHRANEMSCAHCLQSNLDIMDGIQAGEVRAKQCENGMWDFAAPVVVDQQLLAIVFLGQFFLETPDVSFFEKQAERFGYDKKAYLASIQKTPIVSKQHVTNLMICLVHVAEALAKSSLASVRQSNTEDELITKRAEVIELKDILEFYPDGVGWRNSQGEIQYVNKAFTDMFGYAIDDIRTIEQWRKRAFPDQKYRDEITAAWGEKTQFALDNKSPITDTIVTICCKNGDSKRVIMSGSWLRDKLIVNFSDVTSQWRAERLLKSQNDMLNMVARGANLTDILDAIVESVERESSNGVCSILLLDKSGKHLYKGSAPNLPDFYNDAIDGIKIGEGVGSCGAAAFTAQRVIVKDVLEHQNWLPYRELMKKTGLRACWSEPVISSNEKVLGTFAIYYRTPKEPTADELNLISFAANLAAVAIENRTALDELEHRAYYDFLTNLANRRHFIERAEEELNRAERYHKPLSLLMLDIDFFKKINDQYGHKIGDTVLQKLAETALSTLRDVDVIGRLGGEEFAVFLPETGIIQASEVAERLRRAFEQINMSVRDKPDIKFTVSIGISNFNDTNGSIDTLLQQADKALYKAKQTGRNKVCRYA